MTDNDENTKEPTGFAPRKGFRNKKAMSGQQLSQKVADTDSILVMLQNGIRELGRNTMMGMMKLQNELGSVRQQAILAGYRSAALQRLGVERGIFTEEDVQRASDEIRLQDFEKSAAEEDAALGLLEGGDTVKNDDYVTFKLDAVSEDGVALPQLSLFRGRIWVGSGTLVPAIEDAMVGMKVGGVKEFVWAPSVQEFPGLSGKSYTVKIEVFSIKTRPAPTEEEQNAVAEQLEGLAKQVEEAASMAEQKAEEAAHEETTGE